MQLSIEVEREEDGRWITEIPELPGVLAYDESREEAIARAQVLALRVMAERVTGTSSAGSQTNYGPNAQNRCYHLGFTWSFPADVA